MEKGEGENLQFEIGFLGVELKVKFRPDLEEEI